MKFVLFAIIIISVILAISANVGSSLGWGYFPSSAIGVAFYEHNDWLVFFHVLVGLLAMCCWPYRDNRKAMVFVGVAFFSSIFIHLGANLLHKEKEMNVKVDSISYRVSSLELPTIDSPRPYGPSPFKPYSSVVGPNEKIQSLYYTPKEQYGYSLAMKFDEDDKFFLAIHSKEINEINQVENSILIVEENRTLEFYPHKPFANPESIQSFQKFINENLPEITKDIDSKRVSAL